MCGRTACSLEPECIRKACTFMDKNSGRFKLPEWKDSAAGLEYKPSLNIAPTDVTPVLLSASHFSAASNEPIIHPMVWGMIPPWHKGDDYKSHGLSTNNCRLESLQSSKLYSPTFSQGKRCVVLCQGFYEWQTTQKGSNFKQPYFIYAPQPDGIDVDNPINWENGDWSEVKGWTGPKILKMAGIFSSWISPGSLHQGQLICSYSVITMESNSTFSWLHHRMPAILHSDEDVLDWIDFGRIQSTKAFSLLKPEKSLTWHPVSTAVNNSRNKSNQCNKPIDLNKPKASPSSKLMENWLKRSSSSDTSLNKKTADESNEEKKRKF